MVVLLLESEEIVSLLLIYMEINGVIFEKIIVIEF